MEKGTSHTAQSLFIVIPFPHMDYSPITSDLFIGDTPSASDYDHLRELGVQLIINMRIEQRSQPDQHNPPLRFLWLPTIDNPLFPIPV
jgi:hypothetical protein